MSNKKSHSHEFKLEALGPVTEKEFKVDEPDHTRVGDITYIRNYKRWL